jgi:AcrR family transcriptional regulator
MPVRKSRVEQVEVNDARLLGAARQVFTRDGFHAASLEKVARAAGLTKGAVYARFDSKADLMLALLEARVDERLVELDALVSGAAPRAADATVALVRQWAAHVARERDWSLLVLEFRCHAARAPELNRKFARTHTRLRDGMARVLVGRLGLPPRVASDLARVSFALSNGFALERAVDGDAFPVSLYQRAATAMVAELRGPR